MLLSLAIVESSESWFAMPLSQYIILSKEKERKHKQIMIDFKRVFDLTNKETSFFFFFINQGHHLQVVNQHSVVLPSNAFFVVHQYLFLL